LENWTIRFGGHRELAPYSVLVSFFASGTLSCSAATPPSSFPHRASLHDWPKIHSLDLSDLDYSLVDWWRICPSVPLTCSTALGLLLLSGKLDHPVWAFGPSDFPVSESYWPASGQRTRNSHLLRSSLGGQNPQQVLTNPGGSALAVGPMVRTTTPNEDKADTSSVKVPSAQALVARPRNKASDDNLADDDPDLLNFATVKSEIIC
jgi:hypothetical protein